MGRWLLVKALEFAKIKLFAGGVGRFDSHDGEYSEQTDFGWNKQLYYQMRTRSLIADLSRTVGGESQMDAFSGPNLGGVIKRVKISNGDMMRFTMEENIKGNPTYGDRPVRGGQFLEFKNMEARVNNIDSPAIRVVGKMSQQRVKTSIPNLPGETKRQVVDYMSEQLEYEFIPALLTGGSPSVSKLTSDGGLGMSIGLGVGAGAGAPLMNKNWYTPNTGFLPYNTDHAVWNGEVNAAIGNISADDSEMFNLSYHRIIRAKLDDMNFSPATINGKRYKAIAACDPDIIWRLRSLQHEDYSNARERGKSNPIFNVDYMIELDGVLYFSWRNLKKYRPAEGATASKGPNFGPISAEVDPRAYSTTSTNGLIVYMGANAVIEGFNDGIEVTEDVARHKKSYEIAAHMQEGFVRGEWYAKDGRTDVDAVENRNLLIASFYEPGVEQSAP